MKNMSFISGLVTGILFLQIGHALEPNSEENIKWWAGEESYVIPLTGESTLRDILDAGLRPRHVPALGHHTLQFQAKSVTFQFSNGSEIKTKNGYGRIYTGADHRILNITFYEDYKTGIDEAFARLMEARSILNGGGVSEDQLRQQIEEVRNADRHWVDKPFGVGKKGIGEHWWTSVVAGTSFDEGRPFRFITTVIRMYENRKTDRPIRNPPGVLLAPPEGYEHISFDYVTTPTDPNATPIPHLSPLEKAQQFSDKLKQPESIAHTVGEDSSATFSTDYNKSEDRSDVEEEKQTLSAPLAVGIGVFVVSLLMYATLRKRLP